MPALDPESNPLLAPLSLSQRQAVTRTEGHFLVLAGAGSGKTRVITHRIAHLLLDKAVPPHRILAVTFTNKAAKEMRHRLTDMMGGQAPQNLWVTTFHSMGARLLRMNARAAGLDPDFSIFDQDDSLRLVKRLLKEMNIDPKRTTPGSVANAISRFKCDLLTPEDVLNSHDVHNRVPGQVYQRYEAELKTQSAVDFGDLIVRPVRLLSENEEVQRRYQSRFRYLMVDEYQDTNHAQYKLIRSLAGDRAFVCAVGDEDQSIYGWRGADIGNILDFRDDFPGTEVLQLEQNYRCPKPVLDAANQMISKNTSRLKEREVWSEKASDYEVELHEAFTADTEGQWITEAIRYLRMEENLNWSDFAIFYRTHAQARSIEQALMRGRQIPYKIYGGLRFYDRKVIKDLVCYLRLLVNPKDREALARVVNVPKRGVGPKSLSKLIDASNTLQLDIVDTLANCRVLGGKAGKACAALHELLADMRLLAQEVPLLELLRKLIESLDYIGYIESGSKPDDVEHVGELESAMVDYSRDDEEPTLQGFLDKNTLASPTDELDAEGGTVSLMTLHNAKGLEYPVVFVTGLEEGILPHSNSMGMADKVEEERRLLYVGMTRAKQRLFLSKASRRTLHGETTFRSPSSFLDDIGFKPPEELEPEFEEIVYDYDDI